MKVKYGLILCLVLSGIDSFGHDQIVHQAITANAVVAAYAHSPAFGSFINVISSDDRTLQDATNKLVNGSFDEDWADHPGDIGGNRSYNHFYDPLGPTNSYGKGLSDIPPDIRGKVGLDSFTWASISNGVGYNYHALPFVSIKIADNLNTSNTWSWPNARYYEWLGLTASNQTERQTNLDNMFRAVGQVMHLLEDTSQPQHVRNEQHVFPFSDPNANPNANWWVRHLDPWISPIEKYGSDNVRQLNYGDGSMLDWRSAGFTKLEDFWDRHLYNGHEQALNDAEGGGSDTLGLAEWCNGNFIGDRHQYAEYYSQGDIRYYPYPSLEDSTDFDTKRLHWHTGARITSLKSGLLAQRLYLDKTGDGVTFNDHSVMTYFGAYFSTFFASTRIESISTSIRDDEVLSNYHNVFIPKAVTYSAGLLDYYFRGTLGINVSNISGSTYGLSIKNTSSQDLTNGSFHLFYDNNGATRTELTGLNFSTSYSGALAAAGSIGGTFEAPSDAVKYILIYQGTIGTTSGSPSDPVDANIAIAAKNFNIGPPQCDTVVDNIPPNPSDGRPSATYTIADFTMPSRGGTVTIPVDIADSYSDEIGFGIMADGYGEFEIVDAVVTDPDTSGAGTLTLKSKNLTSNIPGTVVPAGTFLVNRNDTFPDGNAVYVPSVDRIFVSAQYDTILVINPHTQILESYFHCSNHYTDEATALVYADDVDRLYFCSEDGNVYVINPHTHLVETIIPFPDEIGAFEGFFDPINNHVGFGCAKDENNLLLVINTTDNSIVANIDIPYANDSPTEYSPVDNMIYAASGAIIQVYSATDFSLVTTLYPAIEGVKQLKYSPVTAEVYGSTGDDGGFYINPLGSNTNATTADFTAPIIGSTATVTVGDTSGMIVGQNVKINGIVWQIAAVDGQTQFEAENLTVTSGTLIASNTQVTWGGPEFTPLPALGSVDYLFYSAADQKVVFSGSDYDTEVFDPITKSVDCTTPNSQNDDLYMGCEGPDGKWFVPYLYNSFYHPDAPSPGGVHVIH